MVNEIAHIEVIPGKEAEFEAGVTQAIPLFERARGCLGVQLQRVIEYPNRYFLLVKWETLEDHTVGFRESEDFQTWRGLVGPFFHKPPEVVHTQLAVE